MLKQCVFSLHYKPLCGEWYCNMNGCICSSLTFSLYQMVNHIHLCLQPNKPNLHSHKMFLQLQIIISGTNLFYKHKNMLAYFNPYDGLYRGYTVKRNIDHILHFFYHFHFSVTAQKTLYMRNSNSEPFLLDPRRMTHKLVHVCVAQHMSALSASCIM